MLVSTDRGQIGLHPGAQFAGGLVEILDLVRKLRGAVARREHDVVAIGERLRGEFGVDVQRDENREIGNIAGHLGCIDGQRLARRPGIVVPGGHHRCVVDRVDGDAAARRGRAHGAGPADAGAAVSDIDVVEVDVLAGAIEAGSDAEAHLHVGGQRGEVLEIVALAAGYVADDIHALQQRPGAAAVVGDFECDGIEPACTERRRSRRSAWRWPRWTDQPSA